MSTYRHTSFYWDLLYCASQILFFFFLLQVEVMWQPCFEQVCQNYFPHIMCSLHFISLCHILVILIIFKNFSLLFYLLRLSVISDFFFFFLATVLGQGSNLHSSAAEMPPETLWSVIIYVTISKRLQFAEGSNDG